MKHTTINGFTIEAMKAKIRKYNNGTKAMFDDDCVYQSEDDNNRCGVGCFIPDDHIALESTAGVGPMLNNHPDLRSLMPLNTVGLEDLQHAHDTAKPTDDVRLTICKWIDENVYEFDEAVTHLNL